MKNQKEYNMLYYSRFTGQTLCRIFIGFAVNAVNHQIYAFLIFIKQIRYQSPYPSRIGYDR